MASSNNKSQVHVEDASEAGGRKIKEDGYVVNEADLLEDLMGSKGCEIITDANPHVPSTTVLCFKCLHCVTTTVIGAITADTNAPISGGTIVGVTLNPGFVFYGRFSSVTLTSGSVIAYVGRM
ncbi:MAG: hypothetical protein PHX80_04300 [Candidatus Nanoarchaeia archaeon]|nr:hypothetical protein [Candidatus Nanoarchaeia archaeon]